MPVRIDPVQHSSRGRGNELHYGHYVLFFTGFIIKRVPLNCRRAVHRGRDATGGFQMREVLIVATVIEQSPISIGGKMTEQVARCQRPRFRVRGVIRSVQ